MYTAWDVHTLYIKIDFYPEEDNFFFFMAGGVGTHVGVRSILEKIGNWGRVAKRIFRTNWRLRKKKDWKTLGVQMNFEIFEIYPSPLISIIWKNIWIVFICVGPLVDVKVCFLKQQIYWWFDPPPLICNLKNSLAPLGTL